MPVTLGIPRETFPGERRVAVTPRACEALNRTGMTVLVEENAGAAAGYADKPSSIEGWLCRLAPKCLRPRTSLSRYEH